ncbi:hypothetical protein PTMSG1_03128 [Pyrenophora teres f. maculata]|nr:hypothetical protein PTMSG1_03128 [Pyrenophora teres f. maculata]
MHFLNVLLIPSFISLAAAWISGQICHSADPNWGTPGTCSLEDIDFCKMDPGPCGYCPGKKFQSAWPKVGSNGGCNCFCA